jgi:hypothetical protein
LIQERVVAGLAAARKRGRLGGRPQAITGEKLDAITAALDGGMSKAAVCRNFNVKRTTLGCKPKPYRWTADPKHILEKLDRAWEAPAGGNIQSNLWDNTSGTLSKLFPVAKRSCTTALAAISPTLSAFGRTWLMPRSVEKRAPTLSAR